ncbi:hypothetical protein CFC21_024471 [Triticum aestivum]|uniref:HMA domain-containing protein n=4 Tax=Triticeae TaxID=147389 RepID=A0A9R1PTT6_TRITD|nr:hypothetical protein CFC21_024471 [Triticum aestivum]VAH49559.1 unnamed protein product [Triticum turgidum subsp. durum]
MIHELGTRQLHDGSAHKLVLGSRAKRHQKKKKKKAVPRDAVQITAVSPSLAHSASCTLKIASSIRFPSAASTPSPSLLRMAPQKVVVKVSSMSDERVKQKAMETVADIYGIDSIAADHKDQKMTVIGDMDSVVIAKKLRKFGRIDILSVGPAKEEKKDDKKGEKK